MDAINPQHYTNQPIECIEITSRLNFCLGNAVKYIWRHKEKGGLEDLKKAQWYLSRQHVHCYPMPEISVATESQMLNQLYDCDFDDDQRDAISWTVQAAANWSTNQANGRDCLTYASMALSRLMQP